MKSKPFSNFILLILVSASLLIKVNSVLADIGRCTKDVAKRKEFIEKSALVIGKFYDGLPPAIRVTENSSQSYKRGRARFLHKRFLALSNLNTATSHKTLCLAPPKGRDYAGTLTLIANSYERRVKTLKRRVKSGHNLDRNKLKIKELSKCSISIEEEIIPRVLDICEHARINIELEKLSIRRWICDLLDPTHSLCND